MSEHKIERRFVSRDQNLGIELRTEGDKRTIVGLASVFYDGTPETEYELWPGLRERILPQAFDRTLADADDVRGLFNHDANLLLGRTASGTVRLSKTSRGLRYEIDPADSSYTRDLVVHLERDDVAGSSFGFSVRAERFIRQDEADYDVREILDVKLYDVSPVTYPAYQATSTGVRAEGDLVEVRSAYKAWKRDSGMSEADFEQLEREIDLAVMDG